MNRPHRTRALVILAVGFWCVAAADAVADPKAPKYRLEQVAGDPRSFYDRRVEVCGEVNADRTILYSGTTLRMHGRVGLQLRGASMRGRNRCLTGRVLRSDGLALDEAERRYGIIVTDSAVKDEWVLVVEH